jgi:predicted Zn-dependent protease
VKLAHLRSAADDFTQAIQFSPGGNPEFYIERAQAVAALGANHVDEAIRGLDEGIRKMGPLVTFQLPAIDLEVSVKRYDAALARVDSIMAKLTRKESWFVRRADILKKAGREKEAKESYRAALDAINALPPTHRRTRVTLDLEAKIREALETSPARPVTADASRK